MATQIAKIRHGIIIMIFISQCRKLIKITLRKYIGIIAVYLAPVL